MSHHVSFASRVAAGQRPALERLLFFNGCQARVVDGIVEAIDRFGPPEIEQDGEWLRVRVGAYADAQSLFALDGATGAPIGVAVYVRPDLEHITVLHVGIAEAYCSGGEREGQRLLLRLLKELRRSSRRMKGVRRMRVLYGEQRERPGIAGGRG